MRLSRFVPVVAAGALLAATTSPALAQQAPAVEGVGTTTGSLTLLALDAGDLAGLDVLSDAGVANIDDARGARSAAAQIAALALDTAVTEPLSVPLLAVESTGEAQETRQDVAVPANPLVSGAALPLSLSAVVGDDGARSALGGSLTDLDVLGGILSLTGASLDLGSNALVTDAAATRGVSAQDLDVLDLEALLAGLGISLTDLSLDTLLGLLDQLGLLQQLQPVLDQLGLDVETLTVESLTTVVEGLLADADDLEEGLVLLEELEANLTDDLADTTCELTDAGDELLGGLLGDGGTLVCDSTQTLEEQLATVETSIADLTAELQAVLDQLQALLTGDGGVLDLLGGTSLLTVDGLDIDVVTKATDDVATSIADVTATLGSVHVGALPTLGTVDLGATTEQVTALLGQVEAAIGDALGEIAPSLSDLVSVRALDEQTSVVEEAGRVIAAAELTGLVVEVQPVLAELEALLAGLGGTGSLGATLEGLGLPVPTSGATEVLALNESLAGVTDGLPLLGGLAALDQPLALRVASLQQESVFTAAAAPAAPTAPAPQPTLPRTGSSDTLVLALAMAGVLVALGGRHLLRRNAG